MTDGFSTPEAPAANALPGVPFISDAQIQHLAQAADWPEFPDDRYEVLEPVGQGGMGTVYRAHDRELDREVAVKVLRLPREVSGDTARILREARLTGRMEHPGMVPVHDVGTLVDGRVYYVMKLIRGRRLDEYVRDTVSLRDRLRVFDRICDTVAFAHAHGVVHRDLKPQNIMVGAFGEVLVMDWGVAKLLTPSRESEWAGEPADSHPACTEVLTVRTGRPDTDPTPITEADTQTRPTLAGTVIGTPRYMSPEQARGDVSGTDRRADVYALGGILRFLCESDAGAGPLPPTTMTDIGTGSSRRSRRVLSAIQARAMSPDREYRYADAAALGADVRAFLDGRKVVAYPEARWERVVRVGWKYRAFIGLMLAYVIMRIAFFAWTGK